MAALIHPTAGDDFCTDLCKALGIDPSLPIMEITIAVKPHEVLAAVVTIEMGKTAADATLDIIRRTREQSDCISVADKPLII